MVVRTSNRDRERRAGPLLSRHGSAGPKQLTREVPFGAAMWTKQCADAVRLAVWSRCSALLPRCDAAPFQANSSSPKGSKRRGAIHSRAVVFLPHRILGLTTKAARDFNASNPLGPKREPKAAIYLAKRRPGLGPGYKWPIWSPVRRGCSPEYQKFRFILCFPC